MQERNPPVSGGRPGTDRTGIEAKDAESGEIRHAHCMTEILASVLINVLLRKGFEKVEARGQTAMSTAAPKGGALGHRSQSPNAVVYGAGPPYEYSHLGQSWAKETG